MAAHSAAPREPVLTRAAVVTALSVLSALLVKTGASDVSTWLSVHSDEVAGGVLSIGPIIAGLLARRHVTPVASPQDSDGTQLVPAPSGAPGGLAVASPLDVAAIAPPVTPDPS